MLFSIGYATKPIDVFIEQLQHHGIAVIAKDRATPCSIIKGVMQHIPHSQ